MSDKAVGVTAKIERASHHFYTLNEEIEWFAKSQRNRVRHHMDGEDQVWIYDGEPAPLGRHVNTVVGDILYNLRSSLDHLAWRLVESNPSGAKPGRHTAFPIYGTPELFQRYGRSKIAGMSKAAKAFIKELQPYDGRDHPIHEALWLLEELGNTDKHRHAILSSGGNATGWGFVDPPLHSYKHIVHHGPVEDGTELLRIERCQVQVDFHPVFGIAFPDTDEIAPGADVYDTLNTIRVQVKRVIRSLRSELT